MDFRCTQCDVTFTMKHNLNRHMKNRCKNLVVVDTEISPSPPEPVVPFTLKTQFEKVDAEHVKCLSCSKVMSRRNKPSHMNSCRGTRALLQCKFCGCMCRNRSQKSRHQKKCDQNPNNRGDKGAAINVDTTNRDIKTDDVSVQPKPKPNQHVYLIQEREFVKTDEPVYKLGRSFKIKNRCGEYPKDSMIITILRVNDCVRAEKYLLSRFEQLFVKRTDIGCEYFEGDEDQMTHEVHNVKHHVY